MSPNSVAISGNDTLVIDNRVIRDMADNDASTIEFPNQIMNMKTGKNGNTIYGNNAAGRQATFRLRLVRGSPDDKYFNAKVNQQTVNPASTILMQGEYVKEIGDGAGLIAADTYMLSGGVVTKPVGGKTNTDGDTEQSVAVYEFGFSMAPRAIT